jgi:hypothetical protein
MDADPVGRYRAEDARPTDGVVRATDGVVVGTPLMDANPVGGDKAEDARPTDLEGEQTYVRKRRRGGFFWEVVNANPGASQGVRCHEQPRPPMLSNPEAAE